MKELKNNTIPYKIYLSEDEMPKYWYNVRADMTNKPAPLLNPGTLKPMTAEELGGVFCAELVQQELDDTTAYIPIPEDIRNFYKMYRPSPLVRAYCLEEKLQTPAKIYYKFEGNNTSGSHKLNSYEQKPFRREVMRTYGANVTPSPSMTTEVGKKILAEFPETTGSLGCAISEAVEAATTREGYRYVLGSVLNQVLLHQSVIGLETKAALDKYGIKPDMIIGCAGGGSNLGGLISPFVGEMLRGEADYKIIAVEPASCPSLTRGVFKYDFCVFEAAEFFARCEGILPAPESSHAIRVAIDEAVKCKETGEERTIVLGLTGTGYFDMVAYGKYNDGEMGDYIPTDEDLAKGFATIPQFPGNE